MDRLSQGRPPRPMRSILLRIALAVQDWHRRKSLCSAGLSAGAICVEAGTSRYPGLAPQSGRARCPVPLAALPLHTPSPRLLPVPLDSRVIRGNPARPDHTNSLDADRRRGPGEESEWALGAAEVVWQLRHCLLGDHALNGLHGSRLLIRPLSCS